MGKTTTGDEPKRERICFGKHKELANITRNEKKITPNKIIFSPLNLERFEKIKPGKECSDHSPGSGQGWTRAWAPLFLGFVSLGEVAVFSELQFNFWKQG